MSFTKCYLPRITQKVHTQTHTQIQCKQKRKAHKHRSVRHEGKLNTFSFETDEINKINGIYIECKSYSLDCGQATKSSSMI